MCGITGFYLPTADPGHLAHRLSAGGLLSHRGPDRFDNWVNPERTLGFQHYRLAIVDLSSAGAQPMHSADGRWVIVFNGEIYNHTQLRAQLKAEGSAPRWRGHSDTETLLAGISAWGLRRTLDVCAGMFAIALYDRVERSLTLARDRMGEKPLYYGYLAGALCLASEPKALRVVAGGLPQLNKGAIAAYMRLGYVPGSESIYEGILRVPPGSIVTFAEQDVEHGRMPLPYQYWGLPSIVQDRAGKASALSTQEALDGLDAVMRQAVKQQMVADVPLGALLSGGIDSSLIVGMMQALSSQPVHTFSIGFDGAAVDEAPYARRVASHLGTTHTELYVSAQDALDLVPRLPQIFCEPFADSSQVPTLLVSQMARRQVTVALTGDGGDELFAGYDRYYRVAGGFARIDAIPLALRRYCALILKKAPINGLNTVARLLGNPGNLRNPADRLRKIAEVLSSESPSVLNRGLITLWEPSALMPEVAENRSVFSGELPTAPTVIEQMMLADSMCYLPDDLLVKVDRSAMAFSLECRAPFLDHRVVEYAWELNLHQKIAGGQSKWLLKQLLERYIPRQLFDRPKQGFGMPIGEWLRGPLKAWAIDMVNYCSARNGFDILDSKKVNMVLDEHLSGKRNWEHKLWTILMFIAWLEAARNNRMHH
ncbi:MAG: asparagine synthase (glutamine-hydrolyzing) [Betaproteobacteria bacterium]